MDLHLHSPDPGRARSSPRFVVPVSVLAVPLLAIVQSLVDFSLQATAQAAADLS
jgi:hypothetical protein